MRISITGHRPEDLPDPEWVREALHEVFSTLPVECVYQGMAAGVDLMSAEVAEELNIPHVACRPWAGHTPRAYDRALYQRVLEQASEVVNVSPSRNYDGVWVYHNRNKYMVDNAEVVVAVWTGKTTGGTAACVRYAKQQRRPIVVIDPVARTITYPETNSGLF